MKVEICVDNVVEVEVSPSEVMEQMLVQGKFPPENKEKFKWFIGEWLIIMERIPDKSIETLDKALLAMIVDFLRTQLGRYEGFLSDEQVGEEQVKAIKRDWVVHVLGADDVHEQPNELTALREANGMNKLIAQQPHGDPYPFCIAVAKDRSIEAV